MSALFVEAIAEVGEGGFVVAVVEVQRGQLEVFGAVHLVGIIAFLAGRQDRDRAHWSDRHALRIEDVLDGAREGAVGAGGVGHEFIGDCGDRCAGAVEHRDDSISDFVVLEVSGEDQGFHRSGRMGEGEWLECKCFVKTTPRPGSVYGTEGIIVLRSGGVCRTLHDGCAQFATSR